MYMNSTKWLYGKANKEGVSYTYKLLLYEQVHLWLFPWWWLCGCGGGGDELQILASEELIPYH